MMMSTLIKIDNGFPSQCICRVFMNCIVHCNIYEVFIQTSPRLPWTTSSLGPALSATTFLTESSICSTVMVLSLIEVVTKGCISRDYRGKHGCILKLYSVLLKIYLKFTQMLHNICAQLVIFSTVSVQMQHNS